MISEGKFVYSVIISIVAIVVFLFFIKRLYKVDSKRMNSWIQPKIKKVSKADKVLNCAVLSIGIFAAILFLFFVISFAIGWL